MKKKKDGLHPRKGIYGFFWSACPHIHVHTYTCARALVYTQRTKKVVGLKDSGPGDEALRARKEHLVKKGMGSPKQGNEPSMCFLPAAEVLTCQGCILPAHRPSWVSL